MFSRTLAILFAGVLLVLWHDASASQVQNTPPAAAPPSAKQPAPNPSAPPPVTPTTRPVDSRAPVSALKVRWEAGKLSLDAEGAPLWEVLQVVSRQAGIVVTGSQGLRDPVYAHFTGVELRPALQGLLSRLDYAIIAGGGGLAVPRGMRVVIFKGSLDSETAMMLAKASKVAAAENSEPQEAKLKAIHEANKAGDRDTLRKYLQDADPVVQSAAFDALALQDKDAAISGILASVRSGTDTMTRLQSLQLLDQSGVADESTMVSALHDVLRDSDPSLSAYAIQSLAGRGSADALDALTDGLHSDDASIRLMVVESVAQTKAGIPLLHEAVSDPDEAVSNAATTLLKQIEAAARPNEIQ
ncbi:MAG TPA: HEAT repeat domain-containing protein [Terriglobia bacterium]|nr:HEAT repeat domain-containing protein [Terriglobia bacterium]